MSESLCVSSVRSAYAKCDMLYVNYYIFSNELSFIFRVGYVSLGFYHHIINIDLNNLADQLMKNIIHCLLISCTGILQTKGHQNPFK